ncbi:MAG TPA: nuclear transport factor 2 family protein, partial [Vicinamibacteria bacterium]|nr:nuclear transport factor 2 family protein [Vicinamibacteria bacterium]
MRRIVSLACFVTAGFGSIACRAAPVDLEAVKGELMEADRAFARETAARGVEGWVEAFAEDGKMFGPGPIIQGHDAIREAMAGIGKDGNTLEWEPVFAEAGPSGDFGYTHGTYRRQRIDADGNPVTETGKYVSIWRRDESGKFRVVLDTGAPDP